MDNLNVFSADIRKHTLRALLAFGGGHVGGCMSMTEVLAVLYGEVMKIDPTNPSWEDRDMLVVSKGHCGPAVYATLALKGYFPVETLDTLNKEGTILPSHCDKNLTPGIDMTTGSLGQGISCAVGLALGLSIKNKDNYVYCILGDGECDEGQVWEAALFASTKKLSNLIVFVDWNKKQLDGFTSDICDLGDVEKKFEDFGFFAQTVDGHNVTEIISAIDKAKNTTDKPSLIVLDTVKGKDCTFANIPQNHLIRFGTAEYDDAIAFLDDKISKLESEL
ncbi:MAG: transketolase [Epulopiscium sp. Nuni2H_MBin003]|nr:MAG: transketolase [Epulopiscium sp. Nuni2H_MBin003]